MSEKYSVQEEAQEICQDAMARIFVNDTAPYDHERANELSNHICDMVIEKLTQTKLTRKYIAQCTVVQNIGAGMHTAASATWNSESDGCYALKAENRAGTMVAILTVFGMVM